MWHDEQWKEPDLACHYLMQIACEVRRVLSKKPNDIQPDQFRVKFKNREQIANDAEVSAELRKRYEGWKQDMAQAQSMARVGLTYDKVKKSNQRPAWAVKRPAHDPNKPFVPDWLQ